MAKFTEHEVVPDVLSAAPAAVADVAWPSGVKAEQGNVLTPTQVRNLMLGSAISVEFTNLELLVGF